MANAARATLSTKLHNISLTMNTGTSSRSLSDSDSSLLREIYDRYYVPPNGESKEPTENIECFFVKLHPVYGKAGYWVRTKDGKDHTLSLKNLTDLGSVKNTMKSDKLYKCLSAIRHGTDFYNHLCILDQSKLKYSLRSVESIYRDLDTSLNIRENMFKYDTISHVYQFADPIIQEALIDYHIQTSIVYE